MPVVSAKTIMGLKIRAAFYGPSSPAGHPSWINPINSWHQAPFLLVINLFHNSVMFRAILLSVCFLNFLLPCLFVWGRAGGQTQSLEHARPALWHRATPHPGVLNSPCHSVLERKTGTQQQSDQTRGSSQLYRFLFLSFLSSYIRALAPLPCWGHGEFRGPLFHRGVLQVWEACEGRKLASLGLFLLCQTARAGGGVGEGCSEGSGFLSLALGLPSVGLASPSSARGSSNTNSFEL